MIPPPQGAPCMEGSGITVKISNLYYKNILIVKEKNNYITRGIV